MFRDSGFKFRDSSWPRATAWLRSSVAADVNPQSGLRFHKRGYNPVLRFHKRSYGGPACWIASSAPGGNGGRPRRKPRAAGGRLTGLCGRADDVEAARAPAAPTAANCLSVDGWRGVAFVRPGQSRERRSDVTPGFTSTHANEKHHERRKLKQTSPYLDSLAKERQAHGKLSQLFLTYAAPFVFTLAGSLRPGLPLRATSAFRFEALRQRLGLFFPLMASHHSGSPTA